MATKEAFSKEVAEIHRLVREVRDYARTAWFILAHRPRVFAVFQRSGDFHWAMWLRMDWQDTSSPSAGIHVGFSNVPLEDHVAYDPFISRYDNSQNVNIPHAFLGSYYILFDGKNIWGISSALSTQFVQHLSINDLKVGLSKLFIHIQEECAHVARESASDEAVRRWEEYGRAFVERMNNTYLMEHLVATIGKVHTVSVNIVERYRCNVSLHTIDEVYKDIVAPLEGMPKLIERARQATKDGKLFIE